MWVPDDTYAYHVVITGFPKHYLLSNLKLPVDLTAHFLSLVSKIMFHIEEWWPLQH